MVGLAGLTTTLFLYYPEDFDKSVFPLLLLFGFLAGAGGATFSVGIPKTSYWFPSHQQGYALGVYAGVGNVGPGVFNFLIPILIGVLGLTGAYFGWLVFLMAATVMYALLASDSFYFQLRRQKIGPHEARTISGKLQQDVFPSGGTLKSLKNPRPTIAPGFWFFFTPSRSAGGSPP